MLKSASMWEGFFFPAPKQHEQCTVIYQLAHIQKVEEAQNGSVQDLLCHTLSLFL